MNRANFWIIVSLFLYSGLTVLLWLTIPSMKTRHEIDSLAYLEPMHRFEENGAFATSDQATNMMSIGYPCFLVAARTVLGKSYNAIIIAQIMLALLCLYFIYSLSLLLFSQKVALIALFLSSFNFALLIYPHFFLSEMVTCFLLIFALERFCRFYYHGDLHALSFSGLSFGCSLVVKGAAILYIPFLTLFIISKYLYRKKIAAKRIALFLIWAAVPVSVYSVRNYNVYGYFYFQTLRQPILYYFFLQKIIESTEGLSPIQSQEKIGYLTKDVKEYASGKGWEDAQHYFFNKCWSYPTIIVSLWIKNIFKTYCGLFTNQLRLLFYDSVKGGDCSFFKFQGSWFEKTKAYLSFGPSSYSVIAIGVFEIFFLLIRYFLVLFSLSYLVVKRKWFIFFIIGSWIIYFPFIAGHDGCARYRTMIELQLTLLAAYGIATLWNMRSTKKITLFAK